MLEWGCAGDGSDNGRDYVGNRQRLAGWAGTELRLCLQGSKAVLWTEMFRTQECAVNGLGVWRE